MQSNRLWLIAFALAQSAPTAFAQTIESAATGQIALTAQTEPLRAYQYGVDALFGGDYERAIAALLIYARAYPDEPGGNLALGLAFMGNGDVAAATAPLERAVRAANPPISAHLQLGLAYALLDDTERAARQRDALALRLQRCRAVCDAFDQDRVERALAQLDFAIESSVAAPEPRAQ